MLSYSEIKGIITPYGLMCVSNPEERERIDPHRYEVYARKMGLEGGFLEWAFTVDTDISPREVEEKVISWLVERSFR